jgi:hypothetical protein
MTEGGGIAKRTVTSVNDSVDTATLAPRGASPCSRSRPTSTPRRVDAFLVEGKGRFRFDPKLRLFSLGETHFAKPPDFELVLLREPREWFNPTMVAGHPLLTYLPGSRRGDIESPCASSTAGKARPKSLRSAH